MTTVARMDLVGELLAEILPQQDYASLRCPGQPDLDGALFAPYSRRIPFLGRARALRPRAGVPLKVRSQGAAGSFSFLTQLVGFESSGRMLLAVPATVTRESMGRTRLPSATELELFIDEEWVPAPLGRLDHRGVTFTFSAIFARHIQGRRVRGRVSASGARPLPVLMKIESVQVAPGTGERIAQARFVDLSAGHRRWIDSLG
ncbi:MAG TPA: hypothetical protein QGF58_21885 [Myxococcota bacterium]|nr:hypothetical protein [Myxococcota bacterium]